MTVPEPKRDWTDEQHRDYEIVQNLRSAGAKEGKMYLYDEQRDLEQIGKIVYPVAEQEESND